VVVVEVTRFAGIGQLNVLACILCQWAKALTADWGGCRGKDDKRSDGSGLLRSNGEHEFTLGVEWSTVSVVGEQKDRPFARAELVLVDVAGRGDGGVVGSQVGAGAVVLVTSGVNKDVVCRSTLLAS